MEGMNGVALSSEPIEYLALGCPELRKHDHSALLDVVAGFFDDVEQSLLFRYRLCLVDQVENRF